MEKRKLVVLFLAFAFLMIPWAQLPAGAADKVVKVGNIEPLSGPSAAVGQQGKSARDMAVEEINAAGGIKSLGGAKLSSSTPIRNPSLKRVLPKPNA